MRTSCSQSEIKHVSLANKVVVVSYGCTWEVWRALKKLELTYVHYCISCFIRELGEVKHQRRRRTTPSKNEFIIYLRNSRLSRFVRFTNRSKIELKLNMLK